MSADVARQRSVLCEYEAVDSSCGFFTYAEQQSLCCRNCCRCFLQITRTTPQWLQRVSSSSCSRVEVWCCTELALRVAPVASCGMRQQTSTWQPLLHVTATASAATAAAAAAAAYHWDSRTCGCMPFDSRIRCVILRSSFSLLHTNNNISTLHQACCWYARQMCGTCMLFRRLKLALHHALMDNAAAAVDAQVTQPPLTLWPSS
jgi:hypothetical protein